MTIVKVVEQPRAMEKHQPRKPAGRPDGGQWTARPHDEADVDLLPAGVRQRTFDEVTRHPNDPDASVIMSATPAEVEWMMAYGSNTHKVLLAGRDDLTNEQYMRLMEPNQPYAVRIEVASKLRPGIAYKASYDPDPTIRAYALYYGWDLPAERVQALKQDPETMRVMNRIGLTPLE